LIIDYTWIIGTRVWRLLTKVIEWLIKRLLDKVL